MARTRRRGVRILRAYDPFTFKTLQGGPAPRFGEDVAGSAHDPSQLNALARMRSRAISAVQRSPIGKGAPKVGR